MSDFAGDWQANRVIVRKYAPGEEMGLFGKFLVVAALALEMGTTVAVAGEGSGEASPSVAYEATLTRWTSYQDVANWLQSNFKFDHNRLSNILQRTRQNGPAGLLARSASSTFLMKSGYCTDAAAFAIQSLNRLNPDYRAQYIFIENRLGQAHHWVAGFMVEGKIMVIDYGASAEWGSMNGVHGPYDSLEQYADFLNSLGIAGFAAKSVEWRWVFPGLQD